MKRKKYALIDMSNIFYMSFFSLMSGTKEEDKKEFFDTQINLWKHLMLNQIIYYGNRFKVDIKNIILCFDSKYIWRKKYFKEYKANRKKGRTDSGIDFKRFFEEMEIFKKELNENFPIFSLEVKNAEADDVIYVLAKNLSRKFDIIVASMDKDLTQVLKFDNVKFFNIKRSGGKWINTSKKSIEENKIRHVLKGDASDGVPNILSDDDTFINTTKRQKPCGDKKINKILDEGVDILLMDSNIKKNYDRNLLMIDLDMIPKDIEEDINKIFIKEFNKEQSWKKALKWLKHNEFNNILNDLDKFITTDTIEFAENSMMETWGKKVQEKRDNTRDLF